MFSIPGGLGAAASDYIPPKEPKPEVPSFAGVLRVLDSKKKEFEGDPDVTVQLDDIRDKVSELQRHGEISEDKLLTLQAHLEMLKKGNVFNADVLTVTRTITISYIVDAVAQQPTQFNHGKVKDLWVRGEPQSATHAYSTPREGRGVLGKVQYAQHEAELREELQTYGDIRKALGRDEEGHEIAVRNLAIDAEEASSPEQKISGKFTLKMKRASTDLEHRAADKTVTIPQRVSYLAQMARGIADLHKAGFTHGDPKPANVLIYDTEPIDQQAKIADMGKSRRMKRNEHKIHVGNPRFSPPEKTDSFAADAYGFGFMAIWTLEQRYVSDENPMLIPENTFPHKSINPEKSRRGIERYAVMHRDCEQGEVTSLRGTISVYSQRGLASVTAPSLTDLEKAETAVHQYIDVLLQKMREDGVPENVLNELGGLLKQLTKSDPAQRPEMSVAAKKLHDILLTLHTLPPNRTMAA